MKREDRQKAASKKSAQNLLLKAFAGAQYKKMNPKAFKKVNFMEEKLGEKGSAIQSKSTRAINKQLKKQQKTERLQGEFIQRDYERQFNRWRDYDLLTCLISGIGLLLQVLTYEYSVHESRLEIKGIDHSDYEVRQATVWRQKHQNASFIPCVNSALSFFGIFSLIKRHYTKALWLHKHLPNEMKNTTIFGVTDPFARGSWQGKSHARNSFRQNFWLEAFMLVVGPVPYWDPIIEINSYNNQTKFNDLKVYYLLSDFILAFMFFRTYFFIRAMLNYSKYTDSFARKLCKTYGVSSGLRYSFRCYMTSNPGTTIGSLFISSVLVLAYVLRIFENPCSFALGAQDFENYFAAIWCIVISITTVGYGDLAPSTIMGRLLIMGSAIWGTFIISLMIVSVTDIFSLSTNEQKSMHHLLQTRKAAQSITAAFRFFVAKKQFERIEAKQEKACSGVYSSQDHVNDQVTRKESMNSFITDDAVSEEFAIVDRIEKQDVDALKGDMYVALADFKQHREELKHLNVALETENHDNVQLIKKEVFDLADRFDEMQDVQEKQTSELQRNNAMMGHLLQSLNMSCDKSDLNVSFISDNKSNKSAGNDKLESEIKEAEQKLLNLHQKYLTETGKAYEGGNRNLLDQSYFSESGTHKSNTLEPPKNPTKASFRHSPFYHHDVLKNKAPTCLKSKYNEERKVEFSLTDQAQSPPLQRKLLAPNQEGIEFVNQEETSISSRSLLGNRRSQSVNNQADLQHK